MKYPVAKPDIGELEKRYVNEALDSAWVSSKGPFIERFESAFASYIGTRYAVACSSGTAALTLALASLGIKPGDEVIVPNFTMIASAWAVSYLGATPVFVGSGNDLNIDVSEIENAITEKTKAIMPVHIYGRPCAMGDIMEIAHDYNLHVVEDACEAHGASIGDTKVGAWGDMGCFSLFGNKIITSGEGGVITTNNTRLYEQLIHLRSMAFNKDHTFLHKKLAFNFRMTNVQAAIALAQTERIDEFLSKRDKIKVWYDSSIGEFSIPRPPGSVLWVYDVKTDRIREAVEFLKGHGIESRVFFQPMVVQPMYRNAKMVGETKVNGIYLPVYTDLLEEDVNFIGSTLKKFLI